MRIRRNGSAAALASAGKNRQVWICTAAFTVVAFLLRGSAVLLSCAVWREEGLGGGGEEGRGGICGEPGMKIVEAGGHKSCGHISSSLCVDAYLLRRRLALTAIVDGCRGAHDGEYLVCFGNMSALAASPSALTSSTASVGACLGAALICLFAPRTPVPLPSAVGAVPRVTIL